MSVEICPSCRKACNLQTTTSTREVLGVDGKQKVVKVLLFHCEVCHQFVRSEEQEDQTAALRMS